MFLFEKKTFLQHFQWHIYKKPTFIDYIHKNDDEREDNIDRGVCGISFRTLQFCINNSEEIFTNVDKK